MPCGDSSDSLKAIYPIACGGHGAAVWAVNGETKRGCVFRRADPRHIIIHKTTECGRGKEPKMALRPHERVWWFVEFVEFVDAKFTSQGMQPCSPSPT